MPFYTVLVDISFEFYEDGTSVYIPEDMVSVLTADTKVSLNVMDVLLCCKHNLADFTIAQVEVSSMDSSTLFA